MKKAAMMASSRLSVPHSRGRASAADTAKVRQLVELTTELAEAKCGQCKKLLLAWWNFCPECGMFIPWEEGGQE